MAGLMSPDFDIFNATEEEKKAEAIRQAYRAPSVIGHGLSNYDRLEAGPPSSLRDDIAAALPRSLQGLVKDPALGIGLADLIPPLALPLAAGDVREMQDRERYGYEVSPLEKIANYAGLALEATGVGSAAKPVLKSIDNALFGTSRIVGDTGVVKSIFDKWVPPTTYDAVDFPFGSSVHGPMAQLDIEQGIDDIFVPVRANAYRRFDAEDTPWATDIPGYTSNDAFPDQWDRYAHAYQRIDHPVADEYRRLLYDSEPEPLMERPVLNHEAGQWGPDPRTEGLDWRFEADDAGGESFLADGLNNEIDVFDTNVLGRIDTRGPYDDMHGPNGPNDFDEVPDDDIDLNAWLGDDQEIIAPMGKPGIPHPVFPADGTTPAIELLRKKNKDSFGVQEIEDLIKHASIPQIEKEMLKKAIKGHEGKISLESLNARLKDNMTEVLPIKKSDTKLYADHGLYNLFPQHTDTIDMNTPGFIGAVPLSAKEEKLRAFYTNADTTVYRNPTYNRHSIKNHFKDPEYYAHVRSTKDVHGNTYITEIQKDDNIPAPSKVAEGKALAEIARAVKQADFSGNVVDGPTLPANMVRTSFNAIMHNSDVPNHIRNNLVEHMYKTLSPHKSFRIIHDLDKDPDTLNKLLTNYNNAHYSDKAEFLDAFIAHSAANPEVAKNFFDTIGKQAEAEKWVPKTQEMMEYGARRADLNRDKNIWYRAVIMDKIRNQPEGTTINFPTTGTVSKVESWHDEDAIIRARSITEYQRREEIANRARRLNVIDPAEAARLLNSLRNSVTDDDIVQHLRATDSNTELVSLYEKDIPKFLQQNFGATKTTDEYGNSWWQIRVTPEVKQASRRLFSGLLATTGGAMAGFKAVEGGQEAQAQSAYPERTPSASEDEYFKANPHVGGMMGQDSDEVVMNPYSKLSDKEKDAVRLNESARITMRGNKDLQPTFDLTPEQKEAFKSYGSEADIKATIAARILSGDPSAKNATPEQKAFVDKLRKHMPVQEAKKFDPEGSDYDYDTATSNGMGPDGTGENAGHWGSVAPVDIETRRRHGLPPESYVVLKGKGHPTYDKMEAAEKERGFKIENVGGRYYSVPKDWKPFPGQPDMRPDRYTKLKDGLILDNDTGAYLGGVEDAVNYFVDNKLIQPFIKGMEKVESNGNPNAKSKSGAVGRMQIIPSKAAKPGYGIKPWKPHVKDDDYRYANEYVSTMYRLYGNINDALMAYNWGPDAVRKWIAKGRPMQGEGAPPKEAKDYAFKVLTAVENILAPVNQQMKGVLNVREYP